MHGIATWDGASELVEPAPAALMALAGGWLVYGTVPALSLEVRLTDRTGADRFLGRGGIQVLSKLPWGRTFTAVPPESLLADPERNLRAILVATEGLRGTPLPSVGRCMAEDFARTMRERFGRNVVGDQERSLPHDYVSSPQGRRARIECEVKIFLGTVSRVRHRRDRSRWMSDGDRSRWFRALHVCETRQRGDEL
jgi:hypothetical protein